MCNNTLQLFQPSTIKNRKEFFSSIAVVFGHFIYMFLYNYIGQEVIDHSVEIFNAM